MAVIVGIVAALLGCCCGAGIMAIAVDRSDPRAYPAESAAPSEETQPLLDLRMGDGADLLAHMLPVPAGAQPLDVVGSTGGVYTLEQYAAKQYPKDPDEPKRLRYREFAVAAERAWVGPDQVEIHIQVLQFRSAWGAEGYCDTDSAAERSTGQTGWYRVEIRGGGGEAVERGAPDARGLRQTVVTALFWNVVLKVYVLTPGQFDRDAVKVLVNSQVDRIRP